LGLTTSGLGRVLFSNCEVGALAIVHKRRKVRQISEILAIFLATCWNLYCLNFTISDLFYSKSEFEPFFPKNPL